VPPNAQHCFRADGNAPLRHVGIIETPSSLTLTEATPLATTGRRTARDHTYGCHLPAVRGSSNRCTVRSFWVLGWGHLGGSPFRACG
jgi:hypothetical protein